MFIGIYSLSVLFSYIGVVFAFLSCYFSITGNLKLSLIMFMVTGLIDALDGKFASLFKRTDKEKKYGVEIDSILDTFNYAAIPLVILYFNNLNQVVDIPIFIFYAFCTTTRLAYFNTVLDEGTNCFYGVPSTMITFLLPIAFIIFKLCNILWVLRILIILISLSFIVNIKIKKSRNLKFYVSILLTGIIITLGLIFIL